MRPARLAYRVMWAKGTGRRKQQQAEDCMTTDARDALVAVLSQRGFLPFVAVIPASQAHPVALS